MSNKFGFNVYSAFTGAFTRVNHFCHPDEKVREYWLEWFTKFAKYTSKLGSKELEVILGYYLSLITLIQEEFFNQDVLNIGKDLVR